MATGGGWHVKKGEKKALYKYSSVMYSQSFLDRLCMCVCLCMSVRGDLSVQGKRISDSLTATQAEVKGVSGVGPLLLLRGTS